mgnify:CR=1 FL=1
MEITLLTVGAYQTNCYIVTADDKSAVVIDPGEEADKIINKAKELGAKVKYILLTHGHFDHIGAADAVKRAFPESRIVVMKADEDICRNAALVGGDNATADPDMLVEDGDIIKVAELSFKYMATPGHTKGSAIIICEDKIFSGDTIMSRTCGRTDLFGGSTKDIRSSLKKIGVLSGDYEIYPGHGPETNMAVERYANPYLRKAMGLGI